MTDQKLQKIKEMNNQNVKLPSVSEIMAVIQNIVERFEKTMQCTCDFDRWEPEKTTGHSCVCNIHKAALDYYPGRNNNSME